jgi:hypothetical protein
MVAHLDERTLHAPGERVHVLLQVLVEVLENEVKAVLAVDDVVKPARKASLETAINTTNASGYY